MREELIKFQTMVNQDSNNKIKVSNDGFIEIQNSERPYLNNRFSSFRLKAFPKDVRDKIYHHYKNQDKQNQVMDLQL